MPEAQEQTRATHTPGPWHLVKMRGWSGHLCIGRRPQNEADEVFGDHPIAVVYEGFANWENKYPAIANGNLMVAAPELLEACRAMLFQDADYARALAVSAIAKAEGR